MKLNKNSIDSLLIIYANDPKGLNFLYRCLSAFEDYHAAVFRMEVQRHVYSHERIGLDDFREMSAANDKARTSAHNNLLGQVRALNRLAEKHGIPPVYDSIVSESFPYRREVADAVFSYLEDIIRNRQ